MISVEWRPRGLNMDPEHHGQGLPVSVKRMSLSERAHGAAWVGGGVSRGGADCIFDMTPCQGASQR